MQSTVNMFSVKIDKFKLTNIDNDMLVNHALDTKNEDFEESWTSADLRLHELNKFKTINSIVEDKIKQVYNTSYIKNR